MQELNQALNEVKELYQRFLGRPAPDLQPGSFAAFAPGAEPIGHAVHEVQFLKRLSEQIALAPRPVSWIPLADCFVAKNEIVIRLEAAGIDRKDLKVYVAGGECLVRGERKPPEWVKEMRPLAVEQSWGPFERRFPLPEGANAEKATAHCEEGVLELRIPIDAREGSKERRVEVT
jgi:HSP20 family protein